MIVYQKWSPYVPKRKLPARGHIHIAVERQQDIDETGKPQTPRCRKPFLSSLWARKLSLPVATFILLRMWVPFLLLVYGLRVAR